MVLRRHPAFQYLLCLEFVIEEKKVLSSKEDDKEVLVLAPRQRVIVTLVDTLYIANHCISSERY